ncbi:MAG: terpene cyclase/mutase family protein [Ahniella sp.]|nr:terpene cyclase/mutase family protein [Ahniella sp.]
MIHRLVLWAMLAMAAESVCAETANQTAQDRGREYLRSVQRADGAIADPADPLFETWETVLATRALARSPSEADRDAVDRALTFLKAQENVDQLVCHNRRCQAVICVETSAEYWGLRQELDGSEPTHRAVTALWAYQQDDGRFLIGNPDVRERKDFVSVTGFALMLPDRGVVSAQNRLAALDWLVTQLQADGSFGRAWEYYGTEAYAVWAVARGISQFDPAQTRTLRDRLTEWLRHTQNPDGSWPAPDDPGVGVSAELVTALNTQSLAALTPDDTAADKARDWLRSRQHADGHWTGGRFPIPVDRYRKTEDLAATAWAIQALDHRP